MKTRGASAGITGANKQRWQRNTTARPRRSHEPGPVDHLRHHPPARRAHPAAPGAALSAARALGRAGAGGGALGRAGGGAGVSDVKLYLGDCLTVLPTLAAGSVDAVITDLPYGTTQCAWDSV